MKNFNINTPSVGHYNPDHKSTLRTNLADLRLRSKPNLKKEEN